MTAHDDAFGGITTDNPLTAHQVASQADALRRLHASLDRQVVDTALVGQGEGNLLRPERQEVDRLCQLPNGRVVAPLQLDGLCRCGLAFLDALKDEVLAAQQLHGDSSTSDGATTPPDATVEETPATPGGGVMTTCDDAFGGIGQADPGKLKTRTGATELDPAEILADAIRRAAESAYRRMCHRLGLSKVEASSDATSAPIIVDGGIVARHIRSASPHVHLQGQVGGTLGANSLHATWYRVRDGRLELEREEKYSIPVDEDGLGVDDLPPVHQFAELREGPQEVDSEDSHRANLPRNDTPDGLTEADESVLGGHSDSSTSEPRPESSTPDATVEDPRPGCGDSAPADGGATTSPMLSALFATKPLPDGYTATFDPGVPGPGGTPEETVIRRGYRRVGGVLHLSDGRYCPDPYVAFDSLDDAIAHVIRIHNKERGYGS